MKPRPNPRLSLLWVFLPSVLLSSSAYGDSLDEALHRELALLKAERKALTDALDKAEGEAKTARRALRDQIQKSSTALIKLRTKNDALRPSFASRERLRGASAQKRQLLQLLDRIDHWLEKHHAEPAVRAPEQTLATRLAELPRRIGAALAELRRSGSLHVVDGSELFADDGLSVKRSVLHIGEVGAISVGQSTWRPLVPVADGSLRTVAGSTAKKQAAGDGNQVVQTVLYDKKEPPPTSKKAATGWIAWMSKGGLLMWPLAILALFALLVALERLVVLSWTSLRWKRLEAPLQKRLQKKQWTDAFDLAKRGKGLAAGLAAILERPDRSRQELEERATEAFLVTRPKLFSRLSLLAVVAASAPLVGLLGTVSGMIGTFSVITQHGTGDPKLLSGGISEALLTTQLGLAVAIPALLFRTGLDRWARRLMGAAEMLSLQVINRIEDQRKLSQSENDSSRGDRHSDSDSDTAATTPDSSPSLSEA
jgi:biopolymer transport protein ExbB